MRVDFYLLGKSRAETVVAALVAKACADAERMLIVAAEDGERRALSQALWEARPEAFLANGLADEPNAARQPVLLSSETLALNQARLLCLADGEWRGAAGFDRVFLLVPEAALAEARRRWKLLGEDDDIERHFWKQDASGRWQEGA